MLTLLAALTVPSLAAEDPELLAWQESPLVCVSAAVLKLRAEGSADAAEVGRVVHGDRVHVLQLGDEEVVSGQVGRWLYARIGRRAAWVHGAQVTTRCVEADLDGDRRAERATLSWSGDDLVVRVRDGASRRSSEVKALSGFEGADRDEQEVSFELLPVGGRGVPLLRAMAEWGPCGWAGESSLVSYVATDGAAARPRVALRVSESGHAEYGYLDMSDLAFSEDHREVTVWRRQQEGSDGELPAPREVRVEFSARRLVNGVFEPDGPRWTGEITPPDDDARLVAE